MNRGPGSAQRRGDRQQILSIGFFFRVGNLAMEQARVDQGLVGSARNPFGTASPQESAICIYAHSHHVRGQRVRLPEAAETPMPAVSLLRCRAHATYKYEAERVEAQGTCSRRLSPTQGKRGEATPH